ncbi:MAG: sulfite exporter TauE/SafE family protein [Labilithrix sp.]|nr:sulfite exporter TauE/SafE family protein [Labilithrix sp.]MCW5812516.1 sulfite exporter TauE/SafE family protein [Labilithrix sp.]
MSALVAAAALAGLFGGVHCATMCGPVTAVVCARERAGGHAIAFNAGRVASYTALGFLAGALGSWTVGHGLDPLRFALRAVAALAMLAVGLHLAGLPSYVRLVESAGAPIWRRIAPLARRLLPLRTPWHAFAAGGLWALMPCGLLYAALAMSASAYSAQGGALAMFAFAVGTLPIMLGLAALAARLMARPIVRRLAGLVVLLCGLQAFASVAAQAGIVPQTSSHCERP